MIDKERAKLRFMRDPIPRRLGGIAASLGRIASSAKSAGSENNVLEMMQEVKYYIEWTAPELEPELAAELADIQIALALWQRGWHEEKQSRQQRTILSFQAKKWSDAVLAASGLL